MALLFVRTRARSSSSFFQTYITSPRTIEESLRPVHFLDLFAISGPGQLKRARALAALVQQLGSQFFRSQARNLDGIRTIAVSHTHDRRRGP